MFVKFIRKDCREGEWKEVLWSGGKHIVGREQLNCNDKRISKHHFSLEFQDQRVVLTALNTYPCFYFSSSSPSSMQIIHQNECRILNDGDEVSFLPDSLRFIVSMKEDPIQTLNFQNGSLTVNREYDSANDTKTSRGNIVCNFGSNRTRSCTNNNNIQQTAESVRTQADRVRDGIQRGMEFIRTPLFGFGTSSRDGGENNTESIRNPIFGFGTLENVRRPIFHFGTGTRDGGATNMESESRLVSETRDDEVIAVPPEAPPQVDVRDDEAVDFNDGEVAPHGSSIKRTENVPSPSVIDTHEEASPAKRKCEEERELVEEDSGGASGAVDEEVSQQSSKRARLEIDSPKEEKHNVENDQGMDVVQSESSMECQAGPSGGVKQEVKEESSGGEVKREEEQDSKAGPPRDKCQYGDKCYRRNPQHRADVSHPGVHSCRQNAEHRSPNTQPVPPTPKPQPAVPGKRNERKDNRKKPSKDNRMQPSKDNRKNPSKDDRKKPSKDDKKKPAKEQTKKRRADSESEIDEEYDDGEDYDDYEPGDEMEESESEDEEPPPPKRGNAGTINAQRQSRPRRRS